MIVEYRQVEEYTSRHVRLNLRKETALASEGGHLSFSG